MTPPGSTPPRPDGQPRRPDARSRPDLARAAKPDPTLLASIAIGIVSVLIAASMVVAAPTPPPVAPPVPSGSASTPTTPDDAFAFSNVAYRDGVRVPVRWNPCQPIEYQLDLIEAPPGARAAIQSAIDRTSEATGIAFVSDGDTDRTAKDLFDRFFFADALHSVYRPVLITAVSHEVFRDLGASKRAVAFAHPEEGARSTDDQYVAGLVVIDGEVPYAHAGRWSMQLVVQHELGHLVGLGHVRDPSQLMFSFEVAHSTIPNPIEGWGEGDLQGLERLGADQGCLEPVRVAG
jgi:hypothetical protein